MRSLARRPSTPSRIVSVILRLAYAIGAALIVFGLSYVLAGPSYFTGALKGNDDAHALTYITWVSRYFPELPQWFPLQGGGISIVDGYPIGAHVAAVVLHLVSGLSLNTCLRLLGFLSLPLTALGVYGFSWRWLRYQTVALLAAVFYLLSPVSWNWITRGGFIGQGFSIVFVPWIMLFVSAYLEDSSYLGAHSERRNIILLVVVLILFFASSLSHYITAVIVLGMIPAYAFVRGAFPDGRGITVRGGISLFRRSLMFVYLGLMMIAFRVVPFIMYSRVANREGLNVIAAGDIPFFRLDTLLGLPVPGSLNVFASDGFAAPVAALAVIGLVVCLVMRRPSFGWGLVTLGSVLFTMLPGVLPSLVSRFAYLWSGTNVRAILPAMILVPFFGASFVAEVSHAIGRLASGGLDRLGLGRGGILSSASAAGIGTVGGLVFAVTVLAAFPMRLSDEEVILDYGPYGLNACDPWERHSPEACRDTSIAEFASSFLPSNWPEFNLQVEDPSVVPGSELIENAARIDVSPYLGQYAERININSDVSQVNTYAFQLSLIHKMWGYQQGVLYSREYGSANAVREIADWFGLSYVFLNTDLDPIEKYASAGWDPALLEGNVEVMKNPKATQLATGTRRPVVLVIGKPETDAYMSIFRLATEGMLSYDDAILVEGSPEVDSYSVSDLGRFDCVVLYGYDYKSGKAAWSLLDQYVKQGGRLFVDTGWEYRIPEWEFESAPEVLPVARLSWTNYGMTSDYALGTEDVAGDVDPAAFAPLIWGSSPWSVSGATISDVRDWGRVVLTVADHPLVVAGQLGEGRVIWSGMNLIAHAQGSHNQEELTLLRHMVSWLIAGRGKGDIPVNVARISPDEVHFVLPTGEKETVWLYWREAYYPNWHAYGVDSSGRFEIPVYRGGPGFMLMPVRGGAGDVSVELVWESPLHERLATGISFFTFFTLAALFADGLFLGGSASHNLVHRIWAANAKRRPRGSVEWLPDEREDNGGHATPNVVDRGPGDHADRGSPRGGPPIEALDGEGQEDVEALLEAFSESKEASAGSDKSAEEMIEWWRRARRDEHED